MQMIGMRIQYLEILVCISGDTQKWGEREIERDRERERER